MVIKRNYVILCKVLIKNNTSTYQVLRLCCGCQQGMEFFSVLKTTWPGSVRDRERKQGHKNENTQTQRKRQHRHKAQEEKK